MTLKKHLTIKDFPIMPEYVPYKSIERILGKRRWKKFCKEMEGNTVSDDSGCYPVDVEKFLNTNKIWD